MKKEINIWILSFVIVAAVVIGLNINNSSNTSYTPKDNTTEIDPYERFRSNNQHVDQENAIKKELDNYMGRNFYQYYETTWFDSVSSTGAVINDYGKTFIIQSKGDSFHEKARMFFNATLGFFNAKTTEAQYLVDKVILIDQDFNVLEETETISW